MNFISYIADRRSVKIHLLILVGLAVYMLVLPAGMWDLRGPDEGRYTQIAKELLTRDNWFALTVMGRPYDQKPPLAFWMFAGTLKGTGGIPNSWALRMPSVMAGIFTLILTYFLGRKFGGDRAGFLSGLFILTSILFLDDAPTVELNMIYTFFSTAAIATWLLNFERDRLGWSLTLFFWLMAAGAFLVKGPLAILIIVSALGYCAWARKDMKPFKAVRFVPGFLFLLVIIGSWLQAQKAAFGSDFVQSQISGETVGRFLRGDHGESFWFYFPRLFTAFMGPWMLVLAMALWALWRNRGNNPEYSAPLLGWLVIPFIVLLLSNGKRVPYLLPLLPAACVLSGIWFESHLANRQVRTRYMQVLIVCMTIAVLALVVTGIVVQFPHAFFQDPTAFEWTDFSRLFPQAWLFGGASVGLLTWLFWRSDRRWVDACWTVGLIILVFQLLDFTLVRPALDRGKSTKAFSEAIRLSLDRIGEDTLLTLPDLAEPEFHVYGNYDVIFKRKSELNFKDNSLPRLIALKQNEIDELGPKVRAAGYRDLFDTTVTKDRVAVYLRAKK